jgi:hypothetical protein
VAGNSEGIDSGPDFCIVKYDPSSGNVIWEARYDGPAHMGDFATAIAVDSSEVYVTGYSYRGMQYKHSDYLTVKYDTSGNLVWDERYDSRRNGNDEATAIAIDGSGVYVTGKSQESSGSDKEKDYDYYTIKYDKSNGKVSWEARYDSENGDDEAAAIAVDSSAIYVTGKSPGSTLSDDYLTVKYDASGNQSWAIPYNGPGNGNDEAKAIAVDSSGIYVTGKSAGSGTGADFCTVKHDPSNGNVLWDVRYDGGNGDDEANAIAVDSSDVFVTGVSTGDGTGADFYTVKYDNSGTVLWEARYDGGNGDDEANAIAINTENVYVTGYSQGNGTLKDYLTLCYLK